MRSTFQNSGMSLSIGVFFSLMIAGLANTLPRTLTAGLTSQGVPATTAGSIAHLPPVSVIFSAMLGYNPVQNLLGPTGVLSRLPAANAATLTGKQFFPSLISGPFHHGLMVVFTAAALMSVTGAIVSLLRGKAVSPQGDDPLEPPGRPPLDAPSSLVAPRSSSLLSPDDAGGLLQPAQGDGELRLSTCHDTSTAAARAATPSR